MDFSLPEKATDGITEGADQTCVKQNVEGNSPDPSNSVIDNSIVKEPEISIKPKKLKPIWVKEMEDIFEFTGILENKCDPNFVAAISGRWVKVLANSFCSKQKIIDFLEVQKFNFYVSPDLETPIKTVRGLPLSTPTEKIEIALNELGFDTIKIIQKIRRTDGKTPSFPYSSLQV